MFRSVVFTSISNKETFPDVSISIVLPGKEIPDEKTNEEMSALFVIGLCIGIMYANAGRGGDKRKFSDWRDGYL